MNLRVDERIFFRHEINGEPALCWQLIWDLYLGAQRQHHYVHTCLVEHKPEGELLERMRGMYAVPALRRVRLLRHVPALRFDFEPIAN